MKNSNDIDYIYEKLSSHYPNCELVTVDETTQGQACSAELGIKNSSIQELKKLIQLELQECDSNKWQYVCEMQSTPKGYARIEEMIIRYVAKEGMPIGSAIALIEQELAHQNA